MPAVVVAIPVKGFDGAKRRLAGTLDAGRRRALGRALAGRVVEAVTAAGLDPVVVAGDREVSAWATGLGLACLDDPGGGLDGAAGAAVELARSRQVPWMVCHADLPLLDAADVAACLDPVESGRVVLAPSADGGTSLAGGTGPFRFAYGPASFHRHLAAASHRRPVVVGRLGLWLDVDGPADLDAALTHHRGAWLRGAMEGG